MKSFKFYDVQFQFHFQLKNSACVPVGSKGEPVNKTGPGGNFEFTITPGGDAQYFSVNPQKGSVGAGATQEVEFIYKPPAERNLNVGGMDLELLNDVGQYAF